jgi:hypothetical protein
MPLLMAFIIGVMAGNLIGMFIMALLVGTHDCGEPVRYEGRLDTEKAEALWDQVNAV